MGINVKDARWPGCSAENFGRFIPCRGGGTTTTYYTDYHHVDEDNRAIAHIGGRWADKNNCGVFLRAMTNTPTSSGDWVASRLIYLS